MGRAIIDERKFNQVKKALKVNASRKDIVKYHEISSESIRLIKNCPSWGQWEQDKVNRSVQLQNKKYFAQRSFIQKIKDYFYVKKIGKAKS